MLEIGTVVTAPDTFVRRVLPVYEAALAGEDFWAADVAAEVRNVGALWAGSGGELDVLLDRVTTMASRLMDAALRDLHVDRHERCPLVRRFSDACGRVAVELVRGFHRIAGGDGSATATPPTAGELAQLLLTGQFAGVETSGVRVAAAYAVVAVRLRGATADAAESAFLRCGGPGTLTLLCGESGYVLLPVRSEEDAVRVCARAADLLRPHDMWTAVVWTDSADVPQGREAASDVLSLVTALRMPPGEYRRRDVLVEYAAVRSPQAARFCRRLIEPVMGIAVLRETLEALIAEDGNRTKAAQRLIIHRSTIDYRLLRIEQLTGHSPSTMTGLRTLTAAYALHSLVEQDRGVDIGLGLARGA
jgi:hypothetical protein